MNPRATRVVAAATIQITICQPSQSKPLELNRTHFLGR